MAHSPYKEKILGVKSENEHNESGYSFDILFTEGENLFSFAQDEFCECSKADIGPNPNDTICKTCG
jgi:hypothetical protein